MPKRRKRDYKRDSKEESSQSGELIVDNQQHDKQVYEHLLPTSKRT